MEHSQPGVVIVGAGIAGLKAAEGLRQGGFTGHITVIGNETNMPYSRPPLSKEALADGIDLNRLIVAQSVDDVEWMLGHQVVSCDLAAKTVTLDDQRVVPFQGLVVASGIRSRHLPIPGPQTGRFTLRTVTDAEALRPAMHPAAQLLILGAGFIGCEVAATARGLGCEVNVVALDAEPMVAALGPQLGAAMRRRHEHHGVQFHLGRTVREFVGDDRITAAVLDDGTELPADVVVEAVGSVPNTQWLEGLDVDVTDGILAGADLVIAGHPAVAAGDVARFPLSRFGDKPRRIEHWNVASETGRHAGRSLAALLNGLPTEPFRGLPSFWSDQYDVGIQAFGLPHAEADIRIVDGDVDGDCIAEFHDEGLIGVVGINRTPDLIPYRRRM
jgi:3-phenylpropionate/trans-cinnamate dioxygenase ferredoxin reductase component